MRDEPARRTPLLAVVPNSSLTPAACLPGAPAPATGAPPLRARWGRALPRKPLQGGRAKRAVLFGQQPARWGAAYSGAFGARYAARAGYPLAKRPPVVVRAGLAAPPPPHAPLSGALPAPPRGQNAALRARLAVAHMQPSPARPVWALNHPTPTRNHNTNANSKGNGNHRRATRGDPRSSRITLAEPAQTRLTGPIRRISSK